MKYSLLATILLAAATVSAATDDQQPYPQLSAKPGKRIAHSPDPLSGYSWNAPSADDGLEIYTIKPVGYTVDKPANVTEGKHSEITVTGPCDIMFDFGQVNAAWFEFDCEDSDAVMEASISEFNQPAVFNLGSQHPVKTAAPVRYGNKYRLELNNELYEGVRFAWIHVRALDNPLTISAPRLVCQIKPTNYNGSFACSDTLLTRSWYTGAYTVKTNLLKDYFGAILMERSDRHSWTGDAHTSQAASMVAFGNYDFVRKNLRYTSTQYNGIPSYSLYWVLSLIDYYNYTGDTALMEEMLENACAKLDEAYAHFGTTHTTFYGWDERLGDFIEPTPESRNAYKMLSIRSWNEFADAMRQYGRAELAAKYRGYADEKVAQVRIESSEWWVGMGVHAASDAVMAQFMTGSENQAIWPVAFADRMRRLSYSPFNQYFIIQAMAQLGRYDEAISTVDDCWGGQLRNGATTFYEVYRPSWNDAIGTNGAPVNNQCGYTSLTHPWSAGITKWLSEEVLGIKPTSPGFGTFTVKPYISSRIRWVKGDVPAPNGTISFELNADKGNFSLHVPQGSSATLALPKAGRTIKKVTFKGVEFKRSAEDAGYVYYADIPAGEYTGQVSYSGKWPATIEEPFQYAETKFAEDTSTKGDWKGKYGRKGYLLCYYDNYDTLAHRKYLPADVRDVVFNLEGNIHWKDVDTDPRALVAPEGNGGRSLGGVYTRDPNVCRQTITIDIQAEEGFKSNISLYFVDLDDEGRRSAIEVFDLKTKELLMPVYMIRDYGGGKYVTFPVSGPVRIRLNHVRGPNAVLSGIFFD